MKRILTILLLACSVSIASAQVTPGPPIAENQGVRLGVYKVLNCSTNLTCALSNNVLSITSSGGSVTNVTASSPLGSTGGATPDIYALQPFVLASPNSGGYYIELNQNTPAIVRMGVEDGSGGGGSIFTGDSINAGVFGTRTNHPVEFFQNDTKRLWLDTSGNLNLSGSVVAGTWAATKVGALYGGTGVDSSGFTGLAYVTAGVWSQGISLTSISGNTAKAATVSGSQTNGKCLEWDASGNVATAVSNAACGSGGSGYATIQDEGTSLTQRATANFIGSGITCTDNSGSSRTDCTINLGTLLDQQNITATGAGTWNKVSGAAMVLVRACGAGGSGGGGSAAGQNTLAAGGGGGGSGACVERWFLASDLGTSESYSVGAGAGTSGGGSGGAGTDGGAGGNTSFGTNKIIGYGGGGGAGNVAGAGGGAGAGWTGAGPSATVASGVSGGACLAQLGSGTNSLDCRGPGSSSAGTSGVNGNYGTIAGAAGASSASDGGGIAKDGGASVLSGGAGGAGGGVTSANSTENGGAGGDTGWTAALGSGGGGAAGLTASACGAGGEGQPGAAGSTIKAGQGAGSGASKQGTSAVGCAGGTGGQPGGGGGGGGGANLGAAGTGTATGGAGGNGGAGELWIWTYGSAAGPNSYTNTAAYSAINNTTTKTYFAIAADGKLPAGVINTAGKRLEIKLSGVYGALISDTIVISVEICQVSGCGSGTVVALAATAALTPTAETNNGWMATVNCNVFTVGASGTLDCQGMTFMGQAAGTGLVSQMQNTTTKTVNTTVDEYVSAAVTWAGVGAPSATDTITLRNFGAQIY